MRNECSRRDVLKKGAASLVIAKCFRSNFNNRGYAQSPFHVLSAQDLRERPPLEGSIELESSDRTLVDGFRWAKSQALAYARTDGTIGSWYEAALPGRNAFCMRDVSHMSTGAQCLGMGSRTLNMLRRFAQNVSASKRWCTWWEITRDNQPAPVDYTSDLDFWYDLPASFDVLDACYRQWLWTRDSAYLREPFMSFYERTVSNYVNTWDRDHDGVLAHLPTDGHMGIGTYDEDLQSQVRTGGDLVAAQYAAYRDYAAIERARANPENAGEYERKAQWLRALYNKKWWNSSDHLFFSAIGEDGHFYPELQKSTGRSTLELPLYYGIPEPGPKTDAVLNALEDRLKLDQDAIHGVIGGVEGRSYLPDVFYQYGRSAAGYLALTAMMDPDLKRREYPEISFTVIGNLCEGLMGIRPVAQSQSIETFPQLSDETEWAELRHVPVGTNIISVRHQGQRETALSNELGPELIWHSGFRGSSASLVLDGRRTPAQTRTHAGNIAESFCLLRVQPGETRVVQHSLAVDRHAQSSSRVTTRLNPGHSS